VPFPFRLVENLAIHETSHHIRDWAENIENQPPSRSCTQVLCLVKTAVTILEAAQRHKGGFNKRLDSGLHNITASTTFTTGVNNQQVPVIADEYTC
jgi:hypothetical protein